MKVKELQEIIEGKKARSAWEKGVKEYVYEMLEGLEVEELTGSAADKETLLNGADSWKQYSWGGCSLIYDEDIAKRLCSPSEFKKTRNGERKPNKNEEWLDVQARALHQACNLILRCLKVNNLVKSDK
jgi:hypothetical protein